MVPNLPQKEGVEPPTSPGLSGWFGAETSGKSDGQGCWGWKAGGHVRGTWQVAVVNACNLCSERSCRVNRGVFT